MTRYRQDERGRLFRWDAGLHTWFRIVSHDDEYEIASLAVLAEAHAATPVQSQSGVVPPRAGTVRPTGAAGGRPASPSSFRSGGSGATIALSIRSSHGPDRRAKR